MINWNNMDTLQAYKALQNTKPATKCDCKCGEHTN